MFQITKIQIFESNSQRAICGYKSRLGCFRLQRYKLLKAIHNLHIVAKHGTAVVSDYKDTNFWKQFTTNWSAWWVQGGLFQTTKIQIFESNSQPHWIVEQSNNSCFRLQRYKLLKAIHNWRNLGQNTWHQQDDCN